MANDKKQKAPEVIIADARMINGSLFEKDTFRPKKGKEGEPAYKIEVAFDKNGKVADDVINSIYDGLEALGIKGKLDVDGGNIISGLKDGDAIATKREKDGKPGDGYRGKFVVRAKTKYNHNGDDAPGGINVFNEDAERIVPAKQSDIYNGCYVQTIVAMNVYTDDDSGNDAISFYLNAVQKIGDGERFASTRDYSQAFKPVGRSNRGETSDRGGRRASREEPEERPSRGRNSGRDEEPSRGRREEPEEEAPRRGGRR